ncbi:hypothetical protein D3C76_964110 [compost metagenome]
MREVQLAPGLGILGVGGEPGGPGLAVLVVVQQAVAHQVARALEAAEVEQPGAAHRKELQQRQGPDEVGAGIHRTGAIGDRQVDIGGRRPGIDRLLVQVQGDMRVAAAEIGQARHQPLLRKLGGHGQAQHRLGGRVAQLVAGLADQLEGLLQMLEQAPRLAGQAHLAAFADEQRNAQLLFELANLMAYGAVGDAQLGGGAAEMTVAGGALEGAQGGQRRQSGHGWSAD